MKERKKRSKENNKPEQTCKILLRKNIKIPADDGITTTKNSGKQTKTNAKSRAFWKKQQQ